VAAFSCSSARSPAAFTLEQGRWKAPSLFALVIGAVWPGLPGARCSYGESLPDEQ
jgi:hypothetical protein